MQLDALVKAQLAPFRNLIDALVARLPLDWIISAKLIRGNLELGLFGEETIEVDLINAIFLSVWCMAAF